MSLIGEKVIFVKNYQSVKGKGNSGSQDWLDDLFTGEVLDKLREYYLIKMDKKSFEKYNKTRLKVEEGDIRRLLGPIFKVYYEDVRDIAESELDNVLK